MTLNDEPPLPRPDGVAFAWHGQSRRLSKDYELLCRTSKMVIYVHLRGYDPPDAVTFVQAVTIYQTVS